MMTEGTERTIQEGLIKGTTTTTTLEIDVVMAIMKIVPGNLSQGQTRSVLQRNMYKTSLLYLVCQFAVPIYMAYRSISVPILISRLNLDSDAADDVIEEGEAMDATNEDDTAMMAMMGMSGFGTTKVWSPFLLFCMNSLLYCFTGNTC